MLEILSTALSFIWSLVIRRKDDQKVDLEIEKLGRERTLAESRIRLASMEEIIAFDEKARERNHVAVETCKCHRKNKRST